MRELTEEEVAMVSGGNVWMLLNVVAAIDFALNFKRGFEEGYENANVRKL